MTRPLAGKVVGDRLKPTKGERQRRAIIEAVRELVAETPIADLTVGRIAAEVGITRSGFYAYFDNKYAALAASMQDVTAEFHTIVAGLGKRQEDEPIEDYLLRIFGASIVLNAQYLAVFNACFQATSSDAQLRTMMEAVVENFVDDAWELLELGPAGVAPDPKLRSVLRMLVAMTTSAGQYFDLTLGDPGGPSQAMDALVQVWKRALWPDA